MRILLKFIMLSFTFIVLGFACDPIDYTLRMENNANYEIVVIANIKGDSTLVNASPHRNIPAQTTEGIGILGRNRWERIMNEIDVLIIFIVDKESYDKHAEEGERRWRNYYFKLEPVKTYYLTSEMLDSLNWVITFP